LFQVHDGPLHRLRRASQTRKPTATWDVTFH
jgi:hypothetical protein